jgi:purine nucleoside permease
MNAAGVLLICTGGGISNATSSIMALGVDPRFDFSRSYWLVAGIDGGDPLDVSVGTAAWAKHVLDALNPTLVDWAFASAPGVQ